MNHTPGPYSIEVEGDEHPFGYIRLWAMNGRVHIGYINKQPGQMERILADAHLWQAGPAMLEACNLIIEAEHTASDDLNFQLLIEATDKARAAIALTQVEEAPCPQYGK